MKKTHILETDIKTVNGKSLLGSGDIDLEGLSTMSNPKLNEEVLTEYRHPISGKPIYTKAIDFGALPNKTTKNVSHNVDYEWMAIDYGSSYSYNLDSGNTISVMNGNYARMYITDQNVTCVSTIDLSTNIGVAVLLYTKTTDTAESPARLVGGGFKFTESDVEPDNPSLGDEWHNTTDDILYKRRKKNGVLDWYEI